MGTETWPRKYSHLFYINYPYYSYQTRKLTQRSFIFPPEYIKELTSAVAYFNVVDSNPGRGTIYL